MLFQEEPFHLIHVDQESRGFIVNQQALRFFQQLENAYPGMGVAIVSVNGVQRTGKSFLLNLLVSAFGAKDSEFLSTPLSAQFKISGKTASCTQGMWLWGKPLVLKDRNLCLLLMDCEGFGSLDKTEGYDAKLFCLSVLLSSMVVFNSMQTIDEKAIDSLALAAELAHKVAQAQEERKLQEQQFVWLVRDFSLQLRNKEGQAISEDDYLESKLSNSKFSSEFSRNVIAETFVRRKCFTMVRPVLDERQLQSLNEPDSFKHLRPQFKEGVRRLVEHIREKLEPRRNLGGSAQLMQASTLSQLIQSFVDQVNKSSREGGVIPNISSAWESIVVQQVDQQLLSGIKLSESQFEGLELPQRPENLAHEVDQLLNSITVSFVDDLRPILPPQAFEQRSQEDENSEESKLAQKFRRNLTQLSKHLEKLVRSAFDRNAAKSVQLFRVLEQEVFQSIAGEIAITDLATLTVPFDLPEALDKYVARLQVALDTASMDYAAVKGSVSAAVSARQLWFEKQHSLQESRANQIQQMNEEKELKAAREQLRAATLALKREEARAAEVQVVISETEEALAAAKEAVARQEKQIAEMQ